MYKLIKWDNFLLVMSSFSFERLTQIYVQKVVYLHGVQCVLSPIEGLSSLLAFGEYSRRCWVHMLILAQHFTCKPMGDGVDYLGLGGYALSLCARF